MLLPFKARAIDSTAVVTNSFWDNWYGQVGLDMNLLFPTGHSVKDVFPNGKSFGVNVALGKWFTPEFGGRFKVVWNNGILPNDHNTWLAPYGEPGANHRKGGFLNFIWDIQFILMPPHPRFMMLIHCRLGDLFSDQYMQEPAIICYENALRYNDCGETNPLTRSYLLQDIGFQYDKLQRYDTARYYYNEALRNSPDTNNLNYKKAQFFVAMLDCTSGDDFENGILKAKKLVLQSPEPYRNWRYVNIGLIYKEVGQNDSALVYLHKVFDNVTKPAEQSYVAEFIHEIYESEGDTLKTAQFAKYLIEKPSNERVGMARVSTLNSMFQDYQTRHQEHQGILHRDDATNHHGAPGVDDGCALKHLGEVVVHALGNLAVLGGTQRRELAPTETGFLAQHAHLLIHFLAQLREFATLGGLAKPVVGGVVLLLLDEIARAMTGIGADIEGRHAFGVYQARPSCSWSRTTE